MSTILNQLKVNRKRSIKGKEQGKEQGKGQGKGPVNYNSHFTDITYDKIHVNDILFTHTFRSNNPHAHLKYKIDNEILNTLDHFILVVDFNHLGGGTTFFLDTIVSIYKKKQTFVIARNFNNSLHLNINDESELSYKYTELESIAFLKQYKNKISKIFVNHLLGHSKMFIANLSTLNKEIITITHDYYNFCTVSNPYYHDIPNITITPRIKPTLSITQNEANLTIFKNQKVLELPDFKNSDVAINTNNHNTVIAILGNITTIKGETILKDIIQQYKNTDVHIIVIGYTTLNCKYYTYNSIQEFNQILLEQKPNMLLELSISPETYSYTLSLCMLTKLPILCLKKMFPSVIENRLKTYSNVHYFTNPKQLNTLIRTKKQSYLYTILPIIYYNKEWNNIFLTKNVSFDKKKTDYPIKDIET